MPRLLPEKTWMNLYYPPADYKYFADAEKYQVPFPLSSNDLSYRKAAWAADAAMLAYGRRGQALMTPAEFEQILNKTGLTEHRLIGDWSKDARGTQGFFAANKDFAILSFRGTERDDPSDSFTDAEALLVHEADYATGADDPGKALGFLSIVEGLFHGCHVHLGFQRALDRVWEDVHETISGYRKAHPAAEIVFTGHSLGAALATLAVSRFGGENASLYTIGSPRVGDEAFGKRVCQNTRDRVFRFVNGYDPVTHIPLVNKLYVHTALDCLHLDNGAISPTKDAPAGDWLSLGKVIGGMPRAGLAWNLNSPAPDALADHSPSRYSIQLWNYLEAHPGCN